MRAIVVDEFGGPEQLRAAEVAIPVPGPGEVLVEIYAAPVNYVDLLVVGGTYQFLPERPFIPGKGPAGIVRACGRGVTALRAGDRVLAMAEQGGYADAAFRRAVRFGAGWYGFNLDPARTKQMLEKLDAAFAKAGRKRGKDFEIIITPPMTMSPPDST